MTKEIDFYFDFISPYSYLAHQKIKSIKNVNFNYKPVLVGGLHNLQGITAPAFIKAKLKHMINDCNLVAKKNKDHYNTVSSIKLNSYPLILNRPVERELITTLYEMSSTELDKQKDARFGNGRCSPDFEIFKDNRPIIKTVANDLINIMMSAVKSEIYIYDSFFNIIGAGGGSTPHNHLMNLDKEKHLNFAKQKYSLVYYLSAGDQNCSEPGVLKLYNPAEDVLPSNGKIVIIPAERSHSAIYNGKEDRVMIGVNFYSL